MLLGKRPRAPMKRTTSLSDISLDLNTASGSDPNDPFNQHGSSSASDQNNVLPMVSPTPRVQRRHSSDFVGTPEFLRACSRCKRRLVPGRDIYMYRGDTAFCSLECRQQQINHDERKEKQVVALKKNVAAAPSSSGSKVTAKGETTVAAL